MRAVTGVSRGKYSRRNSQFEFAALRQRERPTQKVIEDKDELPQLKVPDEESKIENAIGNAKKTAWFLIIFGGIIAIYGVWRFICQQGEHLVSASPDSLAGLGSFLQGAVASVWSLAALMFVYVAFLGQRLQMHVQQRELKETQKEVKKQAEIAAQQRFENTFFELLGLHHGLVTAIGVRRADSTIVMGRSSFDVFGLHLRNAYSRTSDQLDEPERIETAYSQLYEEDQQAVGHYFRNLYHIVLFVDESDVYAKFRYTKILRAQLSSAELFLLFYNGLSGFGKEKFKPLIEKYSLLEQISKNRLLNENHESLYAKSAFHDADPTEKT
jgi:hypothetical protein